MAASHSLTIVQQSHPSRTAPSSTTTSEVPNNNIADTTKLNLANNPDTRNRIAGLPYRMMFRRPTHCHSQEHYITLPILVKLAKNYGTTISESKCFSKNNVAYYVPAFARIVGLPCGNRPPPTGTKRSFSVVRPISSRSRRWSVTRRRAAIRCGAVRGIVRAAVGVRRVRRALSGGVIRRRRRRHGQCRMLRLRRSSLEQQPLHQTVPTVRGRDDYSPSKCLESSEPFPRFFVVGLMAGSFERSEFPVRRGGAVKSGQCCIEQLLECVCVHTNNLNGLSE